MTKYLAGGAPLPRPGVFLWETPSGRRLPVANGLHYTMFDQFMRVDENDPAAFRAGVEDLSGVASLVRLTELYASFNDIADVAPLAELDFLEVLDLEGNRVEDEDAPDYLNMCPALRELSLEGNPIARRVSYRNDVCVAVKRLRMLDDAPVTDADRAAFEFCKEPASETDAPSAERFDELELVADGIKYAAVGIDDPDAITTRDDATGELSVALADEALGGALDADADADADAEGIA